MSKAKRRPGPKQASVKFNETALIHSALAKRKKGELIDLLVTYSENEVSIRRDLENRLGIEKPVGLMVGDIESAIATATDFDTREINYNFSYDHESYEAVEKGLRRLVELGEFEEVKRLCLELMKQGSYQVECSDEGLMTEEIESCLKPVIQAIRQESSDRAKRWATAMLAADRVGFICEKPLRKLAEIE
tara:strand:+ start:259 stop:828 length:570 start_codon:yes stop_codon:yes gene_type:complete